MFTQQIKPFFSIECDNWEIDKEERKNLETHTQRDLGMGREENLGKTT